MQNTYSILLLIGEGSQGKVYLAETDSTNEKVAIKFFFSK